MLIYALFWANCVLNIGLYIIIYYYGVKVYGVKTTLIVNALTASFVIILIITGTYSAADLYIHPLFAGKYGETEFHFTDPISIFPSFMIIFELGRISLKKTRGTELTYKDICLVSILVSVYGVLFQPIGDLASSAVGSVYYLNPPVLNIFGYPIWFIISFWVYGVYAFIFLVIEKKFANRKEN